MKNNISYDRIRNIEAKCIKNNTLNLNTAKDYLNDINNEIFSSSSIPYLVSASYLMSSTNVLKLLYSEYNDKIDT